MPWSLFLWTGSIRMRVFHSGRLPVCICSLLYCVSYLLLLWAGLLAGGEEGVPLSGAGGDSVAPDRFPSGDVRLGGGRQDVLVCNYVGLPRFGGETCSGGCH